MIFAVEHGCFSYRQRERELLKDISFSVASGELTAILGPNGAGKTTLLRCMMGFLPWASGQSTLDGRDIRSFSRRELWQHIAYVPQARTAARSFTVEEMVLLGRSSHFGMLQQPTAADRQLAREAMERLHISHLARRSCGEISGGELQMVLIARAWATQPELLILDEPESNLDFKNQLIILDILSELAAGGAACLFNTHYPAHALQRAHKALILDKSGRHIFGPAARVIDADNIAAAFEVEAVIGEIETKYNVYRDVVPLQVSADGPRPELRMPAGGGDERLATISVVLEDHSYAERVNEILHAYGDVIVGRMGMPYAKKGVSIINVLVEAPVPRIEELAAHLAALPHLNVKTIFARS